ncbi:hypothetical protein K461DRAFT_116903 [Myriangium duriaei CBS 260.36]|uniref:Uncharacterized protein n=1 Tax=Myriangium duriaei CBS 260.36 TaxID=1168546 RepID=A0A9P4J7M5_9PEZI|nr:hypothetical protein K461DRAFT_116903 [Myriangium duriaei CBS 260.36]
MFAQPFGFMDETLSKVDGWLSQSLPAVMGNVVLAMQNLRLKPFATMVYLIHALLEFIIFLAVVMFCTPPRTAPFISIILFVWNIYDTKAARRANRDVLVFLPARQARLSLQGNTNPEDDWVHGQLMPLIIVGSSNSAVLGHVQIHQIRKEGGWSWQDTLRQRAGGTVMLRWTSIFIATIHSFRFSQSRGLPARAALITSQTWPVL